MITSQVENTVILHPVQPASGLSACPGQDVTINWLCYSRGVGRGAGGARAPPIIILQKNS